MQKRTLLFLYIILSVVLSGCAVYDDSTEKDSPGYSEAVSRENEAHVIPEALEERLTVNDLLFETVKPEGLGNSISNLNYLGLVVGDDDGLYTVEYWPKNSDEKREGMQIYVLDAAGKRCLTDEENLVGFMNLTHTALYYVNERGVSMIVRNSGEVKQLISSKEISCLLAAGGKLFYVDADALYSFDLDSQKKSKIAASVLRGYLDYEDNQLYFCSGISASDRQSYLCAMNGAGIINRIYSFDASRLGPIKMIGSEILICAEKAEDDLTNDDRYDLVELDLQKNDKRILVPDYNHALFQNGNQIIAGSRRQGIETYWLIDLKERGKGKLPNWGGGALNYTADRLYAVDVVNVSLKELIRKNDQFYSVLPSWPGGAK